MTNLVINKGLFGVSGNISSVMLLPVESIAMPMVMPMNIDMNGQSVPPNSD